MFRPTTITFMGKLLQQELKDFSKKYITIGKEVTNDFFNGNVLFRSLPKRTSYQNLLNRSRVITNRDLLPPVTQTYSNLFNDVSKDIITFDSQLPLAEALTSISKVKDSLKDRFYGALLISPDRKIKINPLHPLTAMSLIHNLDPTTPLPATWTVALFVYKNRQELDRLYKTSNADTAIIAENIKDLINCYNNRIASFTKTISAEANTAGDVLTLKYRTEIHPDDIPGQQGMLVAHQLLTKGIVIPYYGTSIIKKERGTSGINVSPMLSSNVQHDNSYGNGTHYDSSTTQTPEVIYRSVCTGSSDNTTLEGLRTLTHSNTLSPFNREIITDGSLAYVDACNNASIEIFKLAKLIKEPENDPIPRSTRANRPKPKTTKAKTNTPKTEESNSGSSESSEHGNTITLTDNTPVN